MKDFLKNRPHVLVTDHGSPKCSVKLDGKDFPVTAIKWEVPGSDDKRGPMPIVTLSFYARLEVTGDCEDA